MTVAARARLIGLALAGRRALRRGAAIVREPAAHAERRIHLRHRGACGRCRRRSVCGEPSAPGHDRQAGAGATRSELFAELPAGSIGVSIRFGRDRRMYRGGLQAAQHFRVRCRAAAPRVYFHSDNFNQPNDMALARDGTIYASDPHWRRRDGQVWRIVPDADGTGRGEPMTGERKLGTTNGIDLSPDEKTLYVAESETREIWAYRIEGGKLAAPRLVRKFADFSIDGLRTDIDGRIYVARILKGTIEVLAPDGKTIREIPLRGQGADQPGVRRAGRENRLRHPAQGRLHRDVPRRPAGAGVLFAARAADATCRRQRARAMHKPSIVVTDVIDLRRGSDRRRTNRFNDAVTGMATAPACGRAQGPRDRRNPRGRHRPDLARAALSRPVFVPERARFRPRFRNPAVFEDEGRRRGCRSAVLYRSASRRPASTSVTVGGVSARSPVIRRARADLMTKQL